MTDKTLPENDPDLLLARRIGKYLEDESSTDMDKDPLLDILFQFKQSRKQKIYDIPDSDIHSDEIWDTIAKVTQPGEETATVYRLGDTQSDSKTILAIAASLLVAAFIGIAAYFYLSQQPELIASSSATIQAVTLADGSRVTLRPYSTIKALNVSNSDQSYKLEGEAYFEVKSNRNRTFSVTAGSGKVTVLGTTFNLSSWGNQTQVYLEEGSIEFMNIETDDSVTLNPGEAAEIGPDKRLSTEPAEIIEYTDWMNRELTFSNRSAGYVFNEMEQEFNITISAPDSVINTRLSGSLSLESLDTSLEDLSLVLEGQFVQKGENSYSFVSER